MRLSDEGRREEALAATQEALDIRRQLARAEPDALDAWRLANPSYAAKKNVRLRPL